MPRPSGVPLDLRRRDDDRPARPGRRHQRRHGDRGPLDGGALQPARLRAVRLRRLRPVRRRLHDGGHLQRGRVARRPPASSPNLCWIYDNNHITIEGNTDLAFSDDVADALHRLRLERARASATPTTSSMLAARLRDVQERRPTGRRSSSSTATSATARRTSRTPAPRTASRSARRRSSSPSGPTAGRRTRSSWCPTACYEHFARRHRRARRGSCATAWTRQVRRRTRSSTRSWPTSWTRMQTPRAARGLGQGPADLPGRREGRRRPRRVRQGAERGRARTCPWLVGGSADLAPSTKTRLTFEGAGDFEAADHGGPQLPLRHPRARDGRDPQRHGAVEGAPVRLGLPDLQRLLPPADPAGGDHGDPGHLHLHARLDRRRRGRPDAPAGRAARLAARDPGPDHAAARRRQRGGRGLARHHAAAARAGRAGPDAARRCRRSIARKYAPAAGRRARAPTSWPTRRAASPR